MNDDMLNDKELDRLLSGASSPQLPSGFNDRLLRQLTVETAARRNNVIAFPGKAIVLPLLATMAAALVAGVYVGAATNLQTLISNDSAFASVEDSDLTGFEELDTALQDGQS
jgi:hypothetical protein